MIERDGNLNDILFIDKPFLERETGFTCVMLLNKMPYLSYSFFPFLGPCCIILPALPGAILGLPARAGPEKGIADDTMQRKAEHSALVPELWK